ncbi:unnamed protein product [Ectocarpus sp. 4 AP-2014]
MTAMHLMNSRVIALVRGVPKSFAKAVMDEHSAAALGGKAIDWALASKQHAGYVDALSKIVDSVQTLPALEAHPDCPFVEDTVVYARGIAVTLRQGHDSRIGEVDAVREALATNPALKCVKTVHMEDPDARCDGGDVLFTGRHMFVGISERTNKAGAAALAEAFGPSLPVIPVPVTGALHLKSLVSLLRPGVLLFARNDAGQEAVASMALDVGETAYKAIGVPDQPSANVVSVIHKGQWRGALIQGGRCEESRWLIRKCFTEKEQAKVLEIDYSEMIKPDAALTCCSVLLGGQPA